MRVWLTCFVLLFGAAELYQWVAKLSLPMPIFVLGGIFLALFSNFDQLKEFPFHPEYQDPPLPPNDPSALTPEPMNRVRSTEVVITPAANPQDQPISFTISKPFQPRD
jgi:hypothetical protein